MTITAPGLYPDITAADYFHGITPERALTQSAIKVLLAKTPADYFHGKAADTAAKRLGDVTHQLALGKGRGYAVSDHQRWDPRIKDEKHRIGGELPGEFLDRCERQGLTPIKRADFEAAEAMAAILRQRISAALEGEGYLTEVPFAWIEETSHGPVWCTGMLDVWCDAFLTVLDPKITPYTHDPARHFVGMGWAIQSAWYRRGLAKINPDWAGRLQFKNLLVHPDPPHVSRCISITEGWRANAERDCERALEIFARCLYSGEWPGYPDGDEILDEPSWSQYQHTLLEIDEETA